MLREEIIERINLVLKKNKFMSFMVSDIVINENTSLLDDLSLDSIQILELITCLENEFKICFEAHELSIDAFDSVEKLVNLIEGKI